MRIRVRLFARLREIAAAGELERAVDTGATVDQIWSALTDEFPALSAYRAVISCAVNEEYARFDTVVSAGDEVAFLPPVSGG